MWSRSVVWGGSVVWGRGLVTAGSVSVGAWDTSIVDLNLLSVLVTQSDTLTNGHAALLRDDGHPAPVDSEGVGAIVHDRSVVVRHSQMVDRHTLHVLPEVTFMA